MARQGFHLHSIGKQFVTFKEGDRTEKRYRLELTTDKYIANEQIRQYAEVGWDYVASDSNFHVFEASIANRPQEFPFDAAEQRTVLGSLHKKAVGKFALIAAGVVVMSILLASNFLVGSVPTLRLIEGTFFTTFILLLLNVHHLYRAILEMRGLQHLRKHAKKGKRMSRDNHSPSGFRLHIAANILIFLFMLFGISVPILHLLKMDTATLPIEETHLPFARLAAIENNPQLERDEYTIDDVDWGNFYSANWSIFAPIQYKMAENGFVKQAGQTYPVKRYAPSLDAEIYKVRFHILAEPLAEDLMKWHTYDIAPPFAKKQHAELDLLYIRDTDLYIEFVLQKEEAIMYVKYMGDAKAEVILEHAIEKMKQL